VRGAEVKLLRPLVILVDRARVGPSEPDELPDPFNRGAGTPGDLVLAQPVAIHRASGQRAYELGAATNAS
jgi:hypothetical protein